jgi:hypothetical protein
LQASPAYQQVNPNPFSRVTPRSQSQHSPQPTSARTSASATNARRQTVSDADAITSEVWSAGSEKPPNYQQLKLSQSSLPSQQRSNPQNQVKIMLYGTEVSPQMSTTIPSIPTESPRPPNPDHWKNPQEYVADPAENSAVQMNVSKPTNLYHVNNVRPRKPNIAN